MQDCDTVIAIESNHVKALFRRAQANKVNHGLNRYNRMSHGCEWFHRKLTNPVLCNIVIL